MVTNINIKNNKIKSILEKNTYDNNEKTRERNKEMILVIISNNHKYWIFTKRKLTSWFIKLISFQVHTTSFFFFGDYSCFQNTLNL